VVDLVNRTLSGRSLVGELKSAGKSFDISRWEVWEAYVKVKENQGAPGVDGQSIEDFEKDLKNNLYKIWVRMSSGSYFPPAVRAVEVPKPHDAGTRLLGVPTVSDRIAQTVVARRIEDRVEPVFHRDSYGYRPRRSALDAVAVCRQRCWSYDWVIEFDIRKFFDSVPWDLVIKAVQAHIDEPWVLLYLTRWLAAPMQMPDGTLVARDRGTAQGSPVSPVIANLFLHYAFDMWLSREFPDAPFERYADDSVVHCVSLERAEEILEALTERMEQVGLALHPDKTRIVYCKDDKRRGTFGSTSFTFLGYTFRPRGARDRKTGRKFLSFLPAVSAAALKRIGGVVRHWRLHRRVYHTFDELAAGINPVVAGWMQYYGRFYRSALYPLLARINAYLVRWIRHKYRRLTGVRASRQRFAELTDTTPTLFRHWRWVRYAF
jgi:group II intron reverse transcriptase/maturase